MANPLTPEARPDKDGKVVTRWVKTLETGEPAIPIPAPKAPDQRNLSELLLNKMYVDINEENGYLIDARGNETFYTYEFIHHVLELLPTATLRKLSKHVTEDNGSEQSYLMMPLFSYVEAMYERESDDKAQEIMDKGLTGINNALVFHGPLGTLGKNTRHLRMAEDYMYEVNSGLEAYEGTRSLRTESFEEHVSTVDYSKLPKKERDKAIGFLAASFLSYNYSEGSRKMPTPEAVEFMTSYVDDLERVVSVAEARGFDDMEALREVLEGDVPALSEGIL